MARRYVFMVAIVSAALGSVALAADTGLLPGRYVVKVRLELPNLPDMGADSETAICVDETLNGGGGLRVLSANNPLGTCPISDVRREADTLTFEIACGGSNAAVGSARYALEGDRFTARISMKMGGKNMTMTETQSGVRVGDCADGPKPAQ